VSFSGEHPQAALLSQPAEAVLRRLAVRPECLVLVISGRSLPDLQPRIPLREVVLAGNHGLEIEGCSYSFRHSEAEAGIPRLAAVSADLSALLLRWPGALLEDKRLTATVHYRQVAECDQQALVRAVRRVLAPYAGEFGLRAGKKALEVHPRVGWNKGSAVNWLRHASGVSACLCIGDDRTDETMFRGCSGAVTVAVGRAHSTAADYRVDTPTDVTALVRFAADALERRIVASAIAH
jgi:trehalose-phosphatase